MTDAEFIERYEHIITYALENAQERIAIEAMFLDSSLYRLGPDSGLPIKTEELGPYRKGYLEALGWVVRMLDDMIKETHDTLNSEMEKAQNNTETEEKE